MLISGEDVTEYAPRRTLLLAALLLAVLASGLLARTAPALASSPPVIERFSASHITQNDATVEAQVNSEGLETTYEVFMPEYPCRFSECIVLHLSLAGGSIAATATDESIDIDLASKHVSLEAGERYGVAIVAKNAAGTVEQHYSFRALPRNAAPPSVDSESASSITPTDATLQAQINTEGLETAYEFQIDTNGSYNYTKPDCPLGECDSITDGEPLPAGLVEPKPEYIPAGSGDQTVSLHLASIGATLEPHTTYHFRVIAKSGGFPAGYPMVEGPDQTFTTPSGVVEPLTTTTSPLSGAGQPAGSNTNSGDQPVGPGNSSSSSSSSSPSSSPVGVRSAGVAVAKTAKRSMVPTKARQLAKALRVCRKAQNKRARAKCKKKAKGPGNGDK